MPFISDMSEAIGLIQNRIDSREWWIIPAASDMAFQVVEALERGPYKDHGEFFDALVGRMEDDSLEMISIFMAKKSIATADEICECVGAEPRSMETQDILLTPDMPVSVLRWFMKTFHQG